MCFSTNLYGQHHQACSAINQIEELKFSCWNSWVNYLEIPPPNGWLCRERWAYCFSALEKKKKRELNLDDNKSDQQTSSATINLHFHFA